MSKTKAGRLMSRFIREIAAEATVPVADVEGEHGIRMETKAEALVRTIWKMAEGYTDDAKRVHPPNKDMITLIFERMEGRVPTIDAKDQKAKATVADRVGEQSRKRLNALADEHSNSST